MKNIIFVIENLTYGGAERVTTILANYFSSKSDYNVKVIMFSNEINYDVSDKIEIKIINAPGNNKILNNILHAQKVKQEIVKLDNIQTVVSLSCPATNFYLALSLARAHKKTKLILSERNAPMFYPNSKIGRLFRNISYHFADCVVFQTTRAKNYFSQSIVKKGTVISNPIREDLPEAFCGEPKRNIVNFCRLHPQKNLSLLIEGFAIFVENHPDFTLSIYGDGPQKNDLKRKIAELKIDNKVNIYDFTNDIHSIIVDSYMFVSTSNYEGISNSMIEAMAIGIPVICTDCPAGGAADMIKSGKNGILIEVNNLSQLVSAMNQLADDKELRREISKESVKIRKKLAVQEICKEWENLMA